MGLLPRHAGSEAAAPARPRARRPLAQALASRAAAALVEGVVLLLQVAPLRLSLGGARLFGDLAYRGGFRLRTIRRNLDYVFGESKTPEEKAAIARSALRNVSLTAVEMLAATGSRRRPQLVARVEWAPAKIIDDAAVDPRPTIWCVAHSGNVDLLGQRWTTTKDRPLWVVMKPLENPDFNRLLIAARARYGFGVISTKDPLAKERINEALQRGDAICILPDQNARKRGVVVDFLGKPASTYKGAAATYLRFHGRCNLVVAVGTRPGDGDRHVCYLELIDDFEPTGDHERDVKALTQRICDVMSKYIRQDPSAYLWLHRRWGRLEG